MVVTAKPSQQRNKTSITVVLQLYCILFSAIQRRYKCNITAVFANLQLIKKHPAEMVHRMRVFAAAWCRGLVYFVKAEVGTQALGHDDAVGGLVVFQKGGHDAGQGEGTAVEGVRQFGLAIGVFET